MTRIYWKGKLQLWKKAAISPLNTGLFYGENIFEAVPVYDGKALFLPEHLRRLKRGCDFLGWPFLARTEFEKVIRLFFKASGPRSNFMIRFNLVQELEGELSPRFFSRRRPVLFATVRPLRHRPENPLPGRGKIGVSPWLAPDERSVPNWFKISLYLTTRAVFRDHPEWDEILRLNGSGEVVDGGVSTPMWFDGKKVHVPPLKLGGLESVTRLKIMELCEKLGIGVVERAWRIKDLGKGGELFFAGSGLGLMSPTHLLGRAINKRYSLTIRLWQYYRKWALLKGGQS